MEEGFTCNISCENSKINSSIGKKWESGRRIQLFDLLMRIISKVFCSILQSSNGFLSDFSYVLMHPPLSYSVMNLHEHSLSQARLQSFRPNASARMFCPKQSPFRKQYSANVRVVHIILWKMSQIMIKLVGLQSMFLLIFNISPEQSNTVPIFWWMILKNEWSWK
jgi:hypothetical protein